MNPVSGIRLAVGLFFESVRWHVASLPFAPFRRHAQ
jgi:hypothetical protein